MLHVPQHDRSQAIFPPEGFQGGFVHAAGGNQNEAAGFAGIFLHVDLGHHAAVAGAHENRPLDALLLKKGVHTADQGLIGGQLPGIIEQQHLIVLGQIVHIIHPHFQGVHAAVEQHQRPGVSLSAENIAEIRALHRHEGAGMGRFKGFQLF